MAKAADIGCAVFPLPIMNRNFHNFEIELIGAKNQVKIAERIEFAEKISGWFLIFS